MTELGDYRDAKSLLARFHYIPVDIQYENSRDYSKIKLELGANNLFSSLTYIEPDGEKDIYSFTYDNNGNITRAINTYDNRTTIEDYTYDENGNLIREVITDYDGDVSAFDVEYELVYISFDLSEEELQELFERFLDL